jgi:hypothetical protein
MRAATPQIARSIFTNDTVNFLGPKRQYIERDFEDAILRELEMFLWSP